MGPPQTGARLMIARGVDADGIAETEADHFMKCPGCGEWSTCATWAKCSSMGTTGKSVFPNIPAETF